MAVTLKVIGDKLGLSVATISRALNKDNDPLIPEATKLRIRAVAKEMGYRPNRMARALVSGRTQLIGLWIPRWSSYYAKIAKALQNELRMHGYEMIVSDMEINHYDKSNKPPFSQWPIEGAIMVDAYREIIQTNFKEGLPYGLPIVSIGLFCTDLVDHVGVNFKAGAESALKHLINSGCNRIAHLAPDNARKDQRSIAYDSIISNTRLKPEYIIASNDTSATSFEIVTEYVHAHGCPDGIFCQNDAMGMGAHAALCAMGLKIPDDVSLIGHDGIEEVKFLTPPLSSVILPVEEMCATGWSFLQQRIADASLPLQTIDLLPKLEIRGSTRQ